MGTPLFIYFYLMTTFLGTRSQSRRTRSAGRRSRPNSTGSTSTTTTTTLSQCHHVDCGSRCRHQQTTAAPRRKRANNDSIQRSGTQILADSLRLHDVLKENDRLQRELNAERDFREHLISVVEHREQQWQLLKLQNQQMRQTLNRIQTRFKNTSSQSSQSKIIESHQKLQQSQIMQSTQSKYFKELFDRLQKTPISIQSNNQNNETKNIINKSNELNSEINEIPLNDHENDDASVVSSINPLSTIKRNNIKHLQPSVDLPEKPLKTVENNNNFNEIIENNNNFNEMIENNNNFDELIDDDQSFWQLSTKRRKTRETNNFDPILSSEIVLKSNSALLDRETDSADESHDQLLSPDFPDFNDNTPDMQHHQFSPEFEKDIEKHSDLLGNNVDALPLSHSPSYFMT